MVRHVLLVALSAAFAGSAVAAPPKLQPHIPAPVATSARRCENAIGYGGLGTPPGAGQATPFGAGLLQAPQSSDRVVAIDPRGRDLFFTQLSATGPHIMQSVYRDGHWQPPAQAAFSGVAVNAEPSFSPDGQTLYFVSNRPPSRGTDIWKTERVATGWSEPVRLSDAINGDGFEWHPQVVASGDLYFAAEDRGDSQGGADLYVSRLVNGVYQPAENLGPRINTGAKEWDPYVDPAGTYLIFKSDRPGGYGGLDIYVSVHDADGWSTPRNAGPAVNTAEDEDTGEVTPDGRYMTFARGKAGAFQWNMLWIDMRALLPRTVCGQAQ